MTDQIWPTADLDPVARLRALAAAIPGSAITETAIAAPFETVWAVASDGEQGLPHFVINVRRGVGRRRVGRRRRCPTSRGGPAHASPFSFAGTAPDPHDVSVAQRIAEALITDGTANTNRLGSVDRSAALRKENDRVDRPTSGAHEPRLLDVSSYGHRP